MAVHFFPLASVAPAATVSCLFHLCSLLTPLFAPVHGLRTAGLNHASTTVPLSIMLCFTLSSAILLSTTAHLLGSFSQQMLISPPPCTLQGSRTLLRAYLASVTIAARSQDIPADTLEIAAAAFLLIGGVSPAATAKYKVCFFPLTFVIGDKVLLSHRTLLCLQAVLAQEEGDRKMHVHLQAPSVISVPSCASCAVSKPAPSSTGH